jgi:uncharacterized protein (DUF1810 family)
MSDDPFDLARFVAAQAPVMDRVTAELSAGRKQTHWMWFVFPQLAGLGVSAMAARYAIRSLGEARAYRAHPVLGPRLVACTKLVLDAAGRDAHAIFGSPDDLKFRSSMTLFAEAKPRDVMFQAALDKYFGGEADAKTLQLLNTVDGGI